MIKHCCRMVGMMQNSIDTLNMFGYDPHVTVIQKPLFDRATDFPMLAPIKLELPSFLFANGQESRNLKLAARSIRDYQVDHENAVFSFYTRFSGQETRVVLPIEHILAVSTGSEVEADKVIVMDYSAMAKGFSIIDNPLNPDSWFANGGKHVGEEKPVAKKNPFTVVK